MFLPHVVIHLQNNSERSFATKQKLVFLHPQAHLNAYCWQEAEPGNTEWAWF